MYRESAARGSSTSTASTIAAASAPPDAVTRSHYPSTTSRVAVAIMPPRPTRHAAWPPIRSLPARQTTLRRPRPRPHPTCWTRSVRVATRRRTRSMAAGRGRGAGPAARPSGAQDMRRSEIARRLVLPLWCRDRWPRFVWWHHDLPCETIQRQEPTTRRPGGVAPACAEMAKRGHRIRDALSNR